MDTFLLSESKNQNYINNRIVSNDVIDKRLKL